MRASFTSGCDGWGGGGATQDVTTPPCECTHVQAFLVATPPDSCLHNVQLPSTPVMAPMALLASVAHLELASFCDAKNHDASASSTMLAPRNDGLIADCELSTSATAPPSKMPQNASMENGTEFSVASATTCHDPPHTHTHTHTHIHTSITTLIGNMVQHETRLLPWQDWLCQHQCVAENATPVFGCRGNPCQTNVCCATRGRRRWTSLHMTAATPA